MTPQIVDPEITNILLTSTIKFNKNKTSLTASDIRTNVISSVQNYNTNNLSRFDGVFRYSKVSSTIDATDNSIISNITSIRMRKLFHQLLTLLQLIMFILEMQFTILTLVITRVQEV